MVFEDTLTDRMMKSPCLMRGCEAGQRPTYERVVNGNIEPRVLGKSVWCLSIHDRYERSNEKSGKVT
jgi:hypothetical protein